MEVVEVKARSTDGGGCARATREANGYINELKLLTPYIIPMSAKLAAAGGLKVEGGKCKTPKAADRTTHNAAAMPKAHVVFGELSRLLDRGPYFVGESITLADLILAPQLDFFAATPEWEPLTANFPNIRQWLDRMDARPSMRATTWERVAAMAKAA